MSIIKSALTAEQLSKLKFIDKQVSVFPKVRAGYLAHQLSYDNLKRLVSLLSGRDTIDVLKKDMKIYFIPDGKLRMEDYKEYCRQNGYRITGHPKNADVIVGHEIFLRSDTINASSLSFTLGYLFGRELSLRETTRPSYLNDVVEYIGRLPESGEVVVFGDNILNPTTKSFYYETMSYDAYCITDKLLEVVYWKMAKGIPVINEDVFIDSLEKVVIDEVMYETIKNMLSSSDKNDVIIGFDLMCRSDIMKSAEYIRSLYNQFSWIISKRCRMHTKLAIAFIDAVDDFYHLDDKEFIEYLHQENLLTEKIYYNLARNVLKDLIDSQSEDVALASIVEVAYNMLSHEDYIAKKEPETIINSY